MSRVISVRFRKGGKTYYFSPGELEIKEGDGVIVETARGTEYADVVGAVQEIDEEKLISPLKEVVRVATPYDTEQRDINRAKEKDAYATCMKEIERHGLDMKLVDVEYSFNGSKVVFYFTADGRVDFRELVKDLAGVFRTRIELRQIGVRDEAKMLGGLGSCGRPVCCKAFLSDFAPVSIKMAKEQNLSLSPTKISGICGRLMCCLKYEQDCYETMRRQMPHVGKDVRTPDGDGNVLENNVITERTKVRVALADGTFDVREYPFRELVVLSGRRGERPQNEPCEDESGEEAQQAANDAVEKDMQSAAEEATAQDADRGAKHPQRPHRRKPRPEPHREAPQQEQQREQPAEGEQKHRPRNHRRKMVRKPHAEGAKTEG